MANARPEEQSAQQAEAPEKDSPLPDVSNAAVETFIKTAKARGYVTYDDVLDVAGALSDHILSAIVERLQVSKPSLLKDLLQTMGRWEQSH